MVFVAVKEKILKEPAYLQFLGQGKDKNSEIPRCTMKPVLPKSDYMFSLRHTSIINDQLSVTMSIAHSLYNPPDSSSNWGIPSLLLHAEKL